MNFLWIAVGLIAIAALLYIMHWIEKIIQWRLRRIGVTELTTKQRRRLNRYNETTGRKTTMKQPRKRR